VKLFLPEAGSEEAEALFDPLVANQPFTIHAPDLIYVECANVFRSRVKRRTMSPQTAAAAYATLLELPIEATSTAGIVSDALTLALEYDISVYDACYAATALRLGLPLVTADIKLVAKLRRSAVEGVGLREAAR
jgi:predicted nucleic acid-binding protein